MTLAPWLFVTTLLTPGATPGPAPVPAAPADEQVRPVQAQTTGSAPHTLSFGGSIVAGSNGVSGGLNYWFNEQIGVNMAVAYYIMPHYYSNTSSGSTFQAAPSVMYMLTKPNQTRDVNLRPYLGGGINYVSSSRPYTTTSARATTTATSGTSEQVYGGVEMSFKDTPSMALTFQVIYFNLPQNFAGTGYVGGLNYMFGAHFYVK